jgi:xanthine dehydrogenase molybdenum-binding subunit
VHTVLRQIAAQELGVPPDRVRVVVDTDRDLDGGQTTASRATVLGGNAVLDAAAKVRAALNGGGLAALAGREFGGDFTVDWTTANDTDEPVTHVAYSWATQVAILDDDGRLERIVAAHDVGKAINPTLVEGQIEGGVHMGLGQALSEEFVVEEGVPRTLTLKSLHVIPPTGVPEIECILVEEPQPEGPFGAKGVGEAALVPTAAAVRAALQAYDGVHRTRLPMKDSPAARAAVPHLVRARERT